MEMLPPDQEPLPIRGAGSTKGILTKVDGYVTWLTRVLFWIAGAGLVGMLLLIVADVIGIKILSRPVPGGIEIVSFLAVIAIAFAVGYTQVMRGHVAVDFIVDRFPRRVKLIIDMLMVLFGVCLFATLSYYSFKYAGKLRTTGEVSMTQKIPFYPFVYAMAGCFVVTLLVMIMDLAKSIAKAAQQWTR
ncbi:MAG: TRAP transporter small permease [Actinomycetia bacterium]|nr:TRAP transporter small permease [Actinomycetes bacterium]